ncbi:acylneuraminate cytidylyltransferase family protein [Flavobacterium lacus]|uniref:CMP-N-acetylneuraminic acid synthetase n=1 Tax=Flavobacterium lacus TaxID=1353778 RepID=A0A328WPP0_9FLAO|nr:CMP-N-acetylneuraminic acid synthetase [Flavobacterium lacus]RAR47245.1 CMP-N-acetylneuraminic acid synthetase [Flavobacterium lacus]
MQVAALLTGRGNNTLADKNILPVLGRPLLFYPCNAAKQSKFINSFWASSDCDKILASALEMGYKGIVRPPELALPTSQHIDAIEHALDVMKSLAYKPDILVVMLANSVTIKTEWIDSCIALLLQDEKATAAVPVYREMDHHPYRCKKLNDEGYLEPFFDFSNHFISTNRQDLVPSYFLSHNFWVLNLETIDRNIGQQPWNFMGDKIRHFLVDEAFDVHNLEDIEKSEEWLINNKIV